MDADGRLPYPSTFAKFRSQAYVGDLGGQE